jgi:acetylornithine deacetylase/succinyl-diaminopimelate desuccinylase-like protein
VADGCVYTDGLDLEVHVAQLGGVNFEIELQLDPDHAGPTIATIMEILPLVYADLAGFGRQRSDEIAADPRYAETVWPSYAFRMTLLQAGSLDGANPGGARVHASAYVLPGESIDAMRERIEDRVRASAERWKGLLRPPKIAWVGRMMPPSAIDPNHPFVDAVCRSYQQATGSPARRTGMPMSDLFQFLLHSPRPMPTVAMGPGRWGVPGGAHEPNESILIDEHLIPLTKTLASLMIDWCEVVPA